MNKFFFWGQLFKTFFWFAIAVTIALFIGLAFGEEPDPKQTFEQVWEGYRGKGTIYEKEEMWMVVIDGVEKVPEKRTEGEVKELTKRKWGVKRFTRYLKYDAGLLDKVHIKFTFPPRDSHTQFLIWRYPDRYDEMWLYSPVLVGDRRIRRIATSSQHEDHFMGSSFTYEDIRRLMGEVGVKADPFHFEFVMSKTSTTGISVVPKSAWAGVGVDADTGYSERRFFTPADKKYFTIVEYYKNGRLAKIQKNSYISYENGLWRPLLVEMYDVQARSSTLLYFSERKFLLEQEVPKRIFEISYMQIHGR